MTAFFPCELRDRSPTGKAIGYALGNWKALTRFLADAKIAMGNDKPSRPCAG